MRTLIICLPLVCLFACAQPKSGKNATATETVSPAPTTGTQPTPPMTVTDFSDTETSDWYIQNDGVMGGKSKGTHAVEDGRLVFSGYTVTRGGGFSSVLTDKAPDLSALSGVELRVRGGGRTFEFGLQDGLRDRGREVWRRASFPTTDEWQTVRLPFDGLRATAHGERVDPPVMKADAIETMGFYIVDGKDGDFELEVDWVRGY